jgi:hypothetical protein
MICCPFFKGAVGHPPYLLFILLIACLVILIKVNAKLNKLSKFCEKNKA